jgi:hypothetical protein
MDFNRVVRFLRGKENERSDGHDEMIGKGVIQSPEKEKKEIDDGRIEDCCLLHE